MFFITEIISLTELSSLVFKQIKRDDSGCVTYLIGSLKTKNCAIVDPLLDLDFMIQEIKNAGFGMITHVLYTHTHADHSMSVLCIILATVARFLPYKKKERIILH